MTDPHDDARAAVVDAIRRDGPIPFDRFVDLALYGEHGFYVRQGGGVAGRRGDFLTSPEVGPLFGAVLSRFFDAEWERLGCPQDFVVVEAGAGPGTLARSVLAARPRCAESLRYTAVEVSPAQRERHPDGVASSATMPTAPFDGVVVANELLDNLPFRLAVFDGAWREAYVDVGPDGRFVEILSAPFDVAPAPLPAAPRHGARVPIVDRAGAFVSEARSLVRRGSVVVVDYGVPTTAELASRPWRDWLRTFRGNERGAHYLSAVGDQDVTTDVPVDQLPLPDVVRTQQQFLRLHGIDDLVDEGRRVWTEQAARPGLEAMRMRSRISESEALLDPQGLGGFVVLQWTT